MMKIKFITQNFQSKRVRNIALTKMISTEIDMTLKRYNLSIPAKDCPPLLTILTILPVERLKWYPKLYLYTWL